METLRPITDDLVREITNRIVERFHPKRIIAFGSYARGEHGPDSDLDLIVEMETDLPFFERMVEVASIFGLRDWPMDLIVLYTGGICGTAKSLGHFGVSDSR